MKSDSMDKIISYLSAISTEKISYKNREYEPLPLCFSKNLVRGYTCPEKCGGCCPKFSLDYLPFEDRPDAFFEEREIIVNSKKYIVFSDFQRENKTHFCKYLNLENGRCKIHGKQPFSCDFELLRFLRQKDRNILLTKKYGRGWAMKRVDGGIGALCNILPPSEESIADVRRKLIRLQKWAEYFEIPTKLDIIIKYIESKNFTENLVCISDNRRLLSEQKFDVGYSWILL